MANHAIASESHGSRIIGYIYDERPHDQLEEPAINWASIGNVSIEEARAFAHEILNVCDKTQAKYEELQKE